MIDEELRRIATASHREAARSVDVAADLAEVHRRIEDGDAAPVGHRPARGRDHRRWLIAAATIATVGTGAVVVWSQTDDGSVRTSRPTVVTATPPTSPPPSVVAPPPATDPIVTTTTVDAAAAAPQTIAVDAAAPPPLYEPEPLVTIPLVPNPDGNPVSVAIGERAIAVSQPNTGLVTMVDLTGARAVRDVAVDEPLWSIVLGPGDVVYGFGHDRPSSSEGMPDAFRYVAIPLVGDRAGDVVAEADLYPSTYLELPPGAFGHGPDGVVDRDRVVNRTVLGYVDADGNPLRWSAAPPPLLTWTPDGGDGGRVSVVGSDLAWDLSITKSPDHGGDFIGPNPPAPTSGGRIVYSDTIGADLSPDQDFGPNEMPVVAILEPDGSGRWIRLPDDWSVAASDVWGTVLQRTTADSLELALLDDVLAPPAGTPKPAAVELADRLGVQTLITHRFDSGVVQVVRDGDVAEIDVPGSVWPWSDGEHVMWTTFSDDGAGLTSRSVAVDLDGTVVCEVDGDLYRLRRLPDGRTVASVTRGDGAGAAGELTPLPAFAVDCATESATAIETVQWRAEGFSRRTIAVADRTFTADGDSEGNEHIVNEAGVSVDGDDYAGYHEFSSDGARVVYGDLTGSASPHATATVRARDTTTGDELWTTTLPRPFAFLTDAGDRILAGLAPADSGDVVVVDAIVVLDAASGDQLATVPADAFVLAAS